MGATALDAHTVPFVARLLDAGRSDLVPEAVRQYAERAMARPEWQGVTKGRPTMFQVWLERMRERYGAEGTLEPFGTWLGRQT